MISKSDLIILVLASSALAVAVFRWHQNTQDVNAITIPANSRLVESANNALAGQADNVNSTLVGTATVSAATTSAVNSPISNNIDNTQANGTAQVIVQTLPNPEPVTEIVVTTSGTSQGSGLSLGSHIVQTGDYLGKIAQQYGTDVSTLRELNGISGSIIQVGQEILYPL